MNACQSPAQKMRLQNPGSGMCDSSSRTCFGLMGQGLVCSLLIVHGIVYPARTAVDGISGSPPAGFMLYYAVLM